MRPRLLQRIKRAFKPPSPKQRAREKLLSIDIGPSDIAIDCGANVGKITRIFAEKGATVYAFEPNPDAFDVLQRTFQDAPHVRCIPKGVLDCNGVLPLYLHQGFDRDPVYYSTSSSLLDCKYNIDTSAFVWVDVIDLSEFIQSLNARVRVLKIDVEGVECRILRRLIDRDLLAKIDYLFVETHDHKIPELVRETEALRAYIRANRIQGVDLNWF